MNLMQIVAWLQTWPQLEKLPVWVDYTDAQETGWGIFPAGLEQLERKSDVLGNVTQKCRQKFEMRLVLPYPDSTGENARLVLALQDWVQQQSRQGLAPQLGDVPEAESIRAEKGCLSQLRKPGKAMYTVRFTAEFTKYYEVNK